MEGMSIIALLGPAGVASTVVAYLFGYKKGKRKGFLDGVKTSEENWEKEKMMLYNRLQKRTAIKTEKKDAEVVN